MFITIDTFRFAPPTGFADVTGYSFRARSVKELIDVPAGVLPAGPAGRRRAAARAGQRPGGEFRALGYSDGMC
jgi:hypothetical protein